MTKHANCTHPVTSAARAKCRKLATVVVPVVLIDERMTRELNTSPEPCSKCDRDVWANDEIGCYVDTRWLTDSYGTRYLDCADGSTHIVF